MWGAVVDREVDDLVEELVAGFPWSRVSVREVLGDCGVVAILVTAGAGRLVVAVRALEFTEVDWGLNGGNIADCVGVLPRRECPTVAEVGSCLVVVR